MIQLHVKMQEIFRDRILRDSIRGAMAERSVDGYFLRAYNLEDKYLECLKDLSRIKDFSKDF